MSDHVKPAELCQFCKHRNGIFCHHPTVKPTYTYSKDPYTGTTFRDQDKTSRLCEDMRSPGNECGSPAILYEKDMFLTRFTLIGVGISVTSIILMYVFK